MIGLGRWWTPALGIVLVAGACLSAYLAWRFRGWVGLGGPACEAEPAWRVYAAWSGFVAAAALQMAASASLVGALSGRGPGRAVLPLVVCTAALTVIWVLNAVAGGGWDVVCTFAYPA